MFPDLENILTLDFHECSKNDLILRLNDDKDGELTIEGH